MRFPERPTADNHPNFTHHKHILWGHWDRGCHLHAVRGTGLIRQLWSLTHHWWREWQW